MAASLFGSFRGLDGFARTVDEVKVKTRSGALRKYYPLQIEYRWQQLINCNIPSHPSLRSIYHHIHRCRVQRLPQAPRRLGNRR